MDIMDIRFIMDIMDIMDIVIMIITVWMAMAGAVSALVFQSTSSVGQSPSLPSPSLSPSQLTSLPSFD